MYRVAKIPAILYLEVCQCGRIESKCDFGPTDNENRGEQPRALFLDHYVKNGAIPSGPSQIQ